MKAKTNALLTLIAAAAIGIVGYRNLSRQAVPMQVSAAHCTTDAIRSVNDATTRAILSAQCAKAAEKK